MGTHFIGIIIVIIGLATGIIIAVSNSIETGIITGVIIVAFGMLIVIANFWRLFRSPEKVLPKRWR